MIAILLFILGLCFGSFVNALVWRIHEQDKPKAKRAKVNLSITQGRSVCPSCKHILGPLDLIPVVSWLLLRGKCRYCKEPISVQYPAVELLTGVLFVISYLLWPYGFAALGIAQLIIWLALLVILVALAAYDIKWMLLPDRLTLPLGTLVAAQVFTVASIQMEWWGIVQAAIGALCLGGLFWVLFQVSGGRWIGGGDVKLGAVLGFLVGGPVASILLLFFASLIGTIVTFPLLLTGNKALTRKVPFGPFLIAAAIIVYLCGATIISWYKRQFLLL